MTINLADFQIAALVAASGYLLHSLVTVFYLVRDLLAEKRNG